jgi:hypothetical protein
MGTLVTSLSAIKSLQVAPVLSGGGLGTPFNPSPAGATSLRNDGSQYIFNWQTKGLTAGTYEILLTLADGTVETKVLRLTAPGGSAGLTTDAAGGTGSATGGLLGGDVQLYVDNSTGLFSSDELVRINDTVAAVDAVTESYGVTITEVSSRDAANVILDSASTSAVGGYADGVLGCTTDAGQITIIAGWNFYAGSDPTAIGAGQYDFQTVVTHELGHALGLGHSANAASVMYSTLVIGTANRTLSTADLNVPDSDVIGACGLHAAPASGSGLCFDNLHEPYQPSPITGEGGSWDQPVEIPMNGQDAAINALLADWTATTDFGSHAADLLDKGTPDDHLSHLSLRNTHALDELWSSMAVDIWSDNFASRQG